MSISLDRILPFSEHDDDDAVVTIPYGTSNHTFHPSPFNPDVTPPYEKESSRSATHATPHATRKPTSTSTPNAETNHSQDPFDTNRTYTWTTPPSRRDSTDFSTPQEESRTQSPNFLRDLISTTKKFIQKRNKPKTSYIPTAPEYDNDRTDESEEEDNQTYTAHTSRSSRSTTTKPSPKRSIAFGTTTYVDESPRIPTTPRKPPAAPKKQKKAKSKSPKPAARKSSRTTERIDYKVLAGGKRIFPRQSPNRST